MIKKYFNIENIHPIKMDELIIPCRAISQDSNLYEEYYHCCVGSSKLDDKNIYLTGDINFVEVAKDEQGQIISYEIKYDAQTLADTNMKSTDFYITNGNGELHIKDKYNIGTISITAKSSLIINIDDLKYLSLGNTFAFTNSNVHGDIASTYDWTTGASLYSETLVTENNVHGDIGKCGRNIHYLYNGNSIFTYSSNSRNKDVRGYDCAAIAMRGITFKSKQDIDNYFIDTAKCNPSIGYRDEKGYRSTININAGGFDIYDENQFPYEPSLEAKSAIETIKSWDNPVGGKWKVIVNGIEL